jgi:outer membrane lipoprotein-sorting protein
MKATRAISPVALVIILIAAMSLLVAACGGGDEEEEGGAQTPAAADGGDQQDQTGATPEEEDVDGGEDGDSANLAEELRSRGSEWANVSGRVTYRIEDSENGLSEMTFYQDPPDKSRMDIVSAEGEVIIISTTEGSYFCTSNEGEGVCFNSPPEEGETVPSFFEDFASPEAIAEELEREDLEVESFSDTVAGFEADCFRATGDDLYLGESGTATVCFSENGFLLLATFEGETANFRMEATDFGEVSDSDFEPPYETVDFGDLEEPFGDQE